CDAFFPQRFAFDICHSYLLFKTGVWLGGIGNGRWVDWTLTLFIPGRYEQMDVISHQHIGMNRTVSVMGGCAK
uniref:hypothetical protein n=1 Tax=Massilia sp. TWR1-2-2 TaxID=2804584 RepID=UPI003CEBEACC